MEDSPPSKTPILEWKATEHLVQKRSKRWYISAGLLIIAIVIYSIFTGAWSFLMITTLSALFYFYTHSIEHTEHEIKMWKEGFSFGDTFTDWNACEGFWILRGRNFAELHIAHKEPRKGEIKIQTGSIDPYRIHQVISPYLTEYPDKNENILDTIARICKL